MPPLVRQLFHALVPRALRLWMSKYRGGGFRERLALARATRGRVISGPFTGLRYSHHSVGSAYFPKLLGTYERELHEVIEVLVQRRFGRIVVVGAAEGYYACGLALRCPSAHVVAFETEEVGRAAVAATARKNDLGSQLEIRGACTPAELRRALAGDEPTLVVMDVEGAERELLDPAAVPDLRRAEILLEVHDCYVPGLDQTIRERVVATHEIREIATAPRTADDWARLGLPASLTAARFVPFLDEHRPGAMRWFVLSPKAGA